MSRARVLADYVSSGDELALKAPLASPTFTGNIAMPDDSIDLAHMSANSVDSDQYVDGSIDLAHMSVNSVDSDQYVDGSIDLAHMSANSIDSDQYVDGSIDNAHIADNAIDSEHYAAGSIDNEHLADDAVGTDELANNVTISTSGTITSSAGITETGGVLKENLITNSGFDVWSNSGGLFNPTTGAVPAVDDAGSLFINGDGDSLTGWTDNSGSGSNVGVSGGVFTFNGSVAYALLTSQACAVTKGKLYQIGHTVSVTGHSGNEHFIGTSSGGSQLGYLTEYDDTSAGTFTIVWESTYTGNVYVTWRTGYAALRLDNLMMHEVTPGCVAADTLACDGWYKTSTADIYRQPPHATYTKDGSYYSMKVTTGATNNVVAWKNTTTRNDMISVSRFAGRTVTFGAWVYTTSASHIKLNIDTSASSESAFHGGGGWEWMELTQAVPAATTMFWCRFNHSLSGITSYISQPMLVFGSSIGTGNYTRPKGEVIMFEADVPSNTLHGSNQSDVAGSVIQLEADSNGKIPKGVKAVWASTLCQDSASATTNYARIGLGASGAQLHGAFAVAGLANDMFTAGNQKCICDITGNLTYHIQASGSSTFGLETFEWIGVELQ